MEQSRRGIVLTILAILIIFPAAVSDILKPFHLEGPQTGFVFFGTRTHGIENAILGPLFGLFLIIYAVGILRMKKYALPLAFIYAVYVVLNITLYSINPPPGDQGPVLFLIGFSIVAIGVPWAAAIMLWRRRASLS